MLNLKSCPRCNGDVNVERDWYGGYESCLQCGWVKDASDAPLPGPLQLTLDKLNLEFPELVRAG